MAVIVDLIGFLMIAAIAGLCYLLNNRSAPFQPGSFMSGELGLDLAYPTPAVAAAAVTPVASTSSVSTGAASSVSTGANGTTAAAPLYSVVNGLDMSGSDIPPDASNPSVISQPTYAATGCQAICSSNNNCKAAVYQPSTQACYMKSQVQLGSALVPNSDRVFMIQGTPATGLTHNNGQYKGSDTQAVKLPSAGDCSSLCAGLSYGNCHASVYDPDTTCHIMNNTNQLQLAENYTAWGKNYTASTS